VGLVGPAAGTMAAVMMGMMTVMMMVETIRGTQGKGSFVV
jgi:hypothetical protein